MTAERVSWTTDFLDWVPRIETVGETGITPEQRAEIDEVLGRRAGSTYYEVLANNLDSARTRTVLFSDIFESGGGAPRADRELAATATSRLTGCVYCASVHARMFANLSKQRELTQHLLDHGVDVDLPDRERAVVDVSVRLTASPEAFGPDDIDVLRRQGFDDLAIHDILQSAAIFTNANRLMLSLGEPRRQDAG